MTDLTFESLRQCTRVIVCKVGAKRQSASKKKNDGAKKSSRGMTT